MKKLTILLASIFLISICALAQEKKDVVYLKNGSVIKGEITEMIPNENIKIKTNDGNIFVYSFAEIEKIEKEVIEGLSQSKKETGETAGVFSSDNIHVKTKQGNIVLAGGAGLQFTNSNLKYVYDGETQESGTINSFTVMPSLAYFVIDDLAIGLAGTITSSTTKYEEGDKDISNSLLIIPTAIYYFPIEGKIRPLAQVGVGFSSQTSKYVPKSGSDNKSSASGLAVNFGGGFAYFVKENVSFNFGLSYTMVTLTDGDDNKAKIKQGNFGSNIGIAVYF